MWCILIDPVEMLSTPQFQGARPRIVCRDGASISVQAARYTYCTPRDDKGPYTHVEVGYPSHPFPEGADFKHDQDANDQDTVFAYVPVEIVWEWITKHGGPVSDTLGIE